MAQPTDILYALLQMARLHVHQPVRHELCDPTSAAFGQRLLLLDTDNTTVLPLSDDLWTNRQQQLSRRLLEATSSPICEVLGLQQRQWLQQTLQSSTAALNIIASGSVLAGSVGWREGQYSNACSGDDLGCWQRAQVNLLHTIANASGCSVVITGDFHYSDLKVVQPGVERGYAQQLQSGKLAKPVYQVRLIALAVHHMCCTTTCMYDQPARFCSPWQEQHARRHSAVWLPHICMQAQCMSSSYTSQARGIERGYAQQLQTLRLAKLVYWVCRGVS